MDTMVDTNHLYYGDNLDILGRYIEDDAADLVYLDPPFNSNRDFNIIFGEQDVSDTRAQVQAFEDTWHWDQESARMYHKVVKRVGL